MRNYATWRCLLTVVCVLLVPVVNRSAAGQNPTFNIEGVVTDAQQAVLPGVAVTITNTATGLNRTVTTADNGVGNPRYGQHTGGGSALPSRQFQFALTYRF